MSAILWVLPGKLLKLRSPVSEKYTRYLSIAYHLQLLRCCDYIMLPVTRLGEILGVGTRAVGYYSDQAKKGHYLKLVARHHQPSGKAAKYTFACERFDTETREELSVEEDANFHKDNKDSEGFQESQDQEKTLRTREESERPEGLSGAGIDFERQKGKSGAQVKTNKFDYSGRRKELQEQSRFLRARKQQETS